MGLLHRGMQISKNGVDGNYMDNCDMDWGHIPPGWDRHLQNVQVGLVRRCCKQQFSTTTITPHSTKAHAWEVQPMLNMTWPMNLVTFQHAQNKKISDSEAAKRVLTDWEIWGNHVKRKKNMSIVPMQNYMFLERRKFLVCIITATQFLWNYSGTWLDRTRQG